jgi:YfiH family protein
MNLGFTAEDTAENVRENRRLLVEAVSGSESTPLRTVRQVHSCQSELVPLFAEDCEGAAKTAWDPPQADGLLTRQAGLLLGILTADCVPVLIADPRNRAVAAFHAGWRGTVQRVVEVGIARMAAEFGSEPGTLLAAIGPFIGACCYTVGGEVRARFEAEFPYAATLFEEKGANSGGVELRLDLAEANRRQLIDAGLDRARISRVGGCTSCHPEHYYSHRASSGRAGRMMSLIGIRPATPQAS